MSTMPAILLGVVIAGSVFGHDFFHAPFGPIPITLDRLLLLVAIALFAWRWLKGREDLPNFNSMDLAILVWIACLALNTLSHDWRAMDKSPLSRLLFFNLLPVAVYFLARSYKTKIGDLRVIALVLGGFGIYLALIALAEISESYAIIFPRYIVNSAESEFFGRGRGPFLNPVSNGIFLSVCLCCCWMWWPRINRIGKFGLILAAGLLGAGCFATLTRSVWLGFVVGAGIFTWLPASRQQRGSLILAATIVAIIAFPFVSDKIWAFKRDKDVSVADMEQSAQLRELFLTIAVDMFQDRPLLGCGFGQYTIAKRPYLQDPYSGQPLSLAKPFYQHNVFLAYLVETGLVGLITLLWVLAVVAYASWSLWLDKSLDLWPRQFGLLTLVVIAHYFTSGMFHDVSIIPMNQTLLFFLAGIINNIKSNGIEFSNSQSSPPNTPPVPSEQLELRFPSFSEKATFS
ncbi:O-antigen ligase family protein [Mariniblastus sp.]|nr:O-antigen ligase family protein [Mariniblastus sp.]MDA7923759.1 O-antigen ligase family protein [Mariniblastus sp.]MDC3223800.1 O-antigen ligase family protein [Mariniblastus sp.]